MRFFRMYVYYIPLLILKTQSLLKNNNEWTQFRLLCYDIVGSFEMNEGENWIFIYWNWDRFDMLRNNEDGTLRSVTDSSGKAKKNKGKKSKERETEWTWKEQVDLVKFTKSPIQASLLRLETSDLNKLALEGFLAIMKYMGDYPMAKGQSEVDSVYTILMVWNDSYSFHWCCYYDVMILNEVGCINHTTSHHNFLFNRNLVIWNLMLRYIPS